MLLRLTAALGLHVGGAGGAAAAAAAAAELGAEAGAGASAEAGWGSDGNARSAHAMASRIELRTTYHSSNSAYTPLATFVSCVHSRPTKK